MSKIRGLKVTIWRGRLADKTKVLGLEVHEQPEAWDRGRFELRGNRGNRIRSSGCPQFDASNPLTLFVQGRERRFDHRIGWGLVPDERPGYLVNQALALIQIAGGQADIKEKKDAL